MRAAFCFGILSSALAIERGRIVGNLTDEEFVKELKDHPERHIHTGMAELTACCMAEGVVDLQRIDQHSQYVNMGTNGGVRCDVVSGPCACGAWH